MQGKIIEIFTSIQGEGLWAGKPQTFVRFHGCKLKCQYCDTPLTHHQIKAARIEITPFSEKFTTYPLEFSSTQLDEALTKLGAKSLALTGGEPLEQAEFISDWLQQTKQNYEILLETSGIETAALKQIVQFVDIISCDLKLPSATGEKSYWLEHQVFLEVAQQKQVYAKVVFDENLTDQESGQIETILQQFPNLVCYFQPISPLRKRNLPLCLQLFSRFAQRFPHQVRFLPQVHKSLGVL